MADELGFKISSDIGNALSSLNKLISGLTKANSSYSNFSNAVSNASSQIQKSSSALAGIKLPKLDASDMKVVADSVEESMAKAGGSVKKLQAIIESYTQKASFAREAAQGKGLLPSSVESNIRSAETYDQIIEQLQNNLDKMSGSANKAASSVTELSEAENKSVGIIPTAILGIGKLSSKFDKLLATFKNVVRYRIMRGIVKDVFAALQTGFNNLYQYSKTFSGEFSKNLDGISSSLQYLQNSIASAVAPLVNLLAPALEKIIDLAATAFNALARLFAYLSGAKSYSAATKSMKEYAAATGSAASAAKKLTSYLAGFDELNVLPSADTASGGGGANGADYGSMFEDLPVGDMTDFLDKLKQGIALFAGLAAAIGVISTLLGGLTPFQAVLLTIVGLASTIYGLFDAWTNGIDWTNFAMIFAGIAATAVGLYGILGSTGAVIALIAGGIAAVVVGIRDFLQNGSNLVNTLTVVGGILAVAAGVAIALGGWIPLLVGAIVAAVAAIIMNFDKIKAFFGDVIDNVKNIWDAFVQWFQLTLSNAGAGVNVTIQDIENAWETFSSWISASWKAITTGFSNGVNSIKTWWSNLWAGAKSNWSTFSSSFSQGWDALKTKVRNVIDTVKDVVGNAVSWLKNAFNFQWSLPSIKLPHFSISGGFSFSPPSVPNISVSWYKNGGLPDVGTLFGAGEAGPEVVANMGGGKSGVMNAGQMEDALYNANVASNEQMADVVWQAAQAIVASIAENKAVINIGDDAIGKSADRYNRRKAIMNGVG